MKIFLLSFAVFAMMLTSCSKNEVVDNVNEGSDALLFSPISGNVSSRAVEVVMKDLQDKGVALFALIKDTETNAYFSYFDETLTYKDLAWSTGAKRYLKEGFKNEFYSVYPSSVIANGADLIKTNTEVAFEYTASGAVDLLGAAAKDAYIPSTDGSTGVKVTMPFNHLLAQANFGIKGLGGIGEVKITDIQFNGVGSKGKYTFGTEGKGVNNWSAPAYAAFPMTDAEIDTKAGTPAADKDGNFILARDTYSLMLVPAAFTTTSTITFKFQAYDTTDTEVTNGKVDATIQLDPTTDWTQGMRYVYLIDFGKWFSDRELKFTVEMNDWENNDWDNVAGGGSGIVDVEK